MKEKLKKIFTNKNFWVSILETICAVLIFSIGYFSGFASGLAVDDSIRDKLVETTFDNSKNEKLFIHFDKKELNTNSIITLSNTFTEQVGFHLHNNGDMRKFVVSYNLKIVLNVHNYSNIVVDDIYIDKIELADIYISNGSIDTISLIYYTDNNIFLNYFEDEEYFSFDYNDNVSFSELYFSNLDLTEGFKMKIFINEQLYISTFQNNIENIFGSMLNTFTSYLNTLDDNSAESIFENQISAFNSFIGSDIYLTENLYSINNDLNAIITNIYGDYRYNQGLENGGFSGEDLQNAYESGFYDGKSEGYQEGLEKGVQAGIDGANNSDSVFDRVFMVIRNAGASFLNLFDFYIFPNMPFYVVIAIPFIIGSLFILFKILIK